MKNFLKKISKLAGALLVCNVLSAQTLELPGGYLDPNTNPPFIRPTTNNGVGPITTFGSQDSIKLLIDVGNNNFVTPLPAQTTKVFLKLVNQQYTGLHYNTLSTGLAFGAAGSTAFDPAFPADPITNPPTPPSRPHEPEAFNLFNEIGTYNTNGSGSGSNPGGAPGGPASNMFSAIANTPGSGITAIWDGSSGNDGSGAFSLFTAAQVQYDGGNTVAGDPVVYPRNTPYSATQRYYYGDLVVSFNRFVRNPIISLAGLGGAYRYIIPGGIRSNVADWRSTYYCTELEVQDGLTLERISGNSFFQLSNANTGIINSATVPGGASTSDPGYVDYPFDDLGAASGSVKVVGTVQTITFKVYLKGAPTGPGAADFAWSTSRLNLTTYNREPLTGDLWWIAVSMEPQQLVPLPVKLNSFDVVVDNCTATINWKSETEASFKNYELQYSADGVDFNTVKIIAAKGDNSNYKYTHNLAAGTGYYRLKMVDIDNSFKYSDVVKVQAKCKNVTVTKIYPNPVERDFKTINVSVTTDLNTNATIVLVNTAGQTILKNPVVIKPGNNIYPVTIQPMVNGIYYIKIISADGEEIGTTMKLFRN